MLPRLLRSRTLPRLRTLGNRTMAARRSLVSAPKLGDGPLLERRADRELPQPDLSGMRWARSVPIFLLVLTGCTLGIFNYQKSASSAVASTLYALRTSAKARAFLGDEIYFASKMPWIWGELNALHGRIDISYAVKGNRSQAMMRFRSVRESRQGMFETLEWSLTTKDGEVIDLLDAEDPFKGLDMDPEEIKVVGRGSYSPVTSS